MAKQQKYYVVWKGRRSGIFPTWEECAAQVTGYPNAEYKAFPSRQAAEQAFRSSYDDYKGRHISSLSQQQLDTIGRPIVPSYAVDAACSGNPGLLEYRCVETETAAEVFRQGPFADGTNNIGEFLAIVHALALFKQQRIDLPIYSDSKHALNWVRNKQCKTNLDRNQQNKALFDLIERAEAWLKNNSYVNRLLKWETAAWGEIPADFGRK